MTNSFLQGIEFLISTLINLYVMVIILRLIFPLVRANFYNPLCQFVFTLTNPIVAQLRRFIPSIKLIDIPVLTLLLVLQCIKIILLILIRHGVFGHPIGILVWMLGDTLEQITTLYFFAIIFRVITSWIALAGYASFAPIQEILFLITEPILLKARWIKIPITAIDFSPVFALILIKLFDIMVIYPLIRFGVALSL